MNKSILYLLITFLFFSNIQAQNIDYESRIVSFYGDCNEAFDEEYTWKGWLSDNVNTAETYSGCVTRNNNGAVTQTGTYAVRNQYNVTATQLRTRIDAWEDDNGGRCDYNTGTFVNNDDCRIQTTCNYNFTNPLEYQWTSTTSPTCGAGNMNMRTFYQYRYNTTTISAAVENTSFGFTTGGNRPFWGSLGAWANIGGDCATSGTITDGQTSSFSTTVSCIDQVTFRWNVSSETNYDFLRFYINGNEQSRISGTPGWATVSYNLDPNIDNTLEWRYTKDGSISSNLDRGFVDQITYSNYTIPTAGLSFGVNTWNVSCYNGRNLNLSGVTYRGYYVDNNLNINTINSWASAGTPSDATSYDGCSVGVDNHTFVHKRQGFPCGVYNINVTGHDDEIRLYVNGAPVWNFAGCCTNHGTVWTGYLTTGSTVEVRVAEGGGGSNLTMDVVDVTPTLNGGVIAGTQSICTGGDPSNLSSSSAASGGTLAYTTINYQWQFSNNNSTWSNIGGETGTTYNPPAGLTQTRYYRRRVIDACGDIAYSNTLTVTANPLPNANLAGSTSICSGNSGNIIFNATAGSGPWDIVYNGTTLNNITSGTSISVSPSSTTTYTLSSITDNNGCVRTTGLGTSATITVNPLPNANLSSTGDICLGLTGAVVFTSITGASPFDVVYNGTISINNISSGNNSTVIPTSNTTYTLTSLTDNNGCVRTSGFGTSATINIKTQSTAATAANASSTFSCSGEAVDLSVSGGSLGTAATWEWYSDASFTTSVGSGSPLTVNPTSTTTYYVRAEGDCNNTSGQSVTVNINGGSIAPNSSVVLATSTSSSSCFVNDAAWHYYYNSSGELLAAINSNGQDLGNVTVNITVGDNGPFGQGFPSGVCGYTGASDGEYVMPRYWDITVVNQPSSPVDVIFYYENDDVTSLVTTLNGLNSNYISCWGDVNLESDLMMTVSHTSGNSELFSSLAFANGPNTTAGQRQIAFQLSEFSGGKLHSSGGITGPGNALPVEMISFTAETVNNEAIRLDWITATEINNEGFEVQRGTDGTSFEKIAWIAGNGNSNKNLDYSLLDKQVEAAIVYYYRLKQVDFDGAFEYSKVVSASLVGENGVVVSYFIPNPSTDLTALVFEVQEETKVQIEILDNLGRRISLKEQMLEGGKETISFDLNEYATGVYTAKILMNNEEFTRKLVVRK